MEILKWTGRRCKKKKKASIATVTQYRGSANNHIWFLIIILASKDIKKKQSE